MTKPEDHGFTAPPLWTIDDLAAHLGLSTRAIYNRVHRGDDTIPPPVHIGRLLRWQPEQVEEWIDKHRNPVVPMR